MSRAVPGDGKLRQEITARGEAAEQAAAEYFNAIMADPTKTKNNMDTATAEKELVRIRRMRKALEQEEKVMEEAYEHHRRQTSVLPNNIFKQRRRIRADGSVDVIDKLDPATFAARANADGMEAMTPAQRASYIERGTNPHRDFFNWSPDVQRSYLLGEHNPDGEEK